MRQISFGFASNYKKEFGGSLLKGSRKSIRPLSRKHPIHLVLKSDQKGVFNPGNRSLEDLIRSQAVKFGLQLYDFSLNWSHIHLLLRIPDRQNYVKFIRSLTSLLVVKIRELKPDLEVIFSLRPFTRVLSWGRDFKMALKYQVMNQLEALGFLQRTKPKRKPKRPPA